MNDLVIICSNTDFDENPLGAKPLAISLSENHFVIYVDPPFSVATAIRKKNLRKKIFSKKSGYISNSLYRLSPVVLPGKDRKYIHKVTSLLLRRKIQKTVSKIVEKSGPIETKPILIATAPHYEIFTQSFFNIYWMMDDYASQPELTGIDEEILKKGQRYQCDFANKIVTVSKELSKIIDEKNKKKIVEIPNGADADLFRFPVKENNLPSKLPSIPGKNFALYVGGINDRVDLDYLQAISDKGIELVLAGPVSADINFSQFENFCSKEHVSYLGPIEYELIPWLMNKASVGLVPYRDNNFNRVSMPLKIPEYLMCGLQVVSTNLPFTRNFDGDDLKTAEDLKGFVAETQRILDNPALPSQRAMRSARIAQEWSWDSKAEKFIKPLS